MSAARVAFLSRIQAFQRALEADVIVSRDLSQVEFNETARIFRNGLIVVGFATLEEFIRARTREILATITGAHVRFDDLPAALRRATVQDVLPALTFQTKLLEKDVEVVDLIRVTGGALASTSNATFELSPLAFASQKSNLQKSDLKNILEAFHVPNPWGNIDLFASRVGLSTPKHEAVFGNALEWRNAAAHRAAAETGAPELSSFYQHALGIAIGFDALLTRGGMRVAHGTTIPTQQHDIRLRFIDADKSGWWRDRAETKSKAAARSKDLEDLRRAAIGRATPRQEIVVIRNNALQPMGWITTPTT